MDTNAQLPPGQPGIAPRWTSSAKNGVGTAANGLSRVWFTLSHGIVNEVYYPVIDQANTRDLGFLVTDGSTFFSEEKRDTFSEIQPLAQGVPGYRLTNRSKDGRFCIKKTVVTDPVHDVLIQQVSFEPLQGHLADYNLYALLAPHIANQGYGNNGWVGEYKGLPMLFAERAGRVMAMGCSTPFKGMSCGYVGTSDGWQDISRHKRMTWFYPKAPDGNIALTGEVDLVASGGNFILALGFGTSPEEAGQRARTALLNDFEEVRDKYVGEWLDFQGQCDDLSLHNKDGFDLYRVSLAVLKTHEAKSFIGGMIASLSIPWGFSKGDNDMGGYHLVWPRDLIESAGGLLAAGDYTCPNQTAFYLMSTQEADGHWPQNMWLNGAPYWYGLQLDETALLILLADHLKRHNRLRKLNIWPTLRKAATFVAANGPVTQEDRWEENAGYSPFTLAIEIAGLLAAADFAVEAGENQTAAYLRETADAWNSSIEGWTYVTDTDLAKKVGVEGYYVRIASPEPTGEATPYSGYVPIRNCPPDQANQPVSHIVSPDALALVRYGLRAPNDPRILNTIKVIDAVLKTDTATGPVWHRYNYDGYGEHADGSAFNGTGIGRGWPLLTGERAHYELAAGNFEEAQRLLQVMGTQAGQGGLIPEQVWDAPDIVSRHLYNGCPSHSARPLVWAHAEYIKLLHSLREGKIFDMPPGPVERYQKAKITSIQTGWRFNNQSRTILEGKQLRVETLAPATVHWSLDGWQTVRDSEMVDTGLGIYFVDLPTENLKAGSQITFTFYWSQVSHWEGVNFTVDVVRR